MDNEKQKITQELSSIVIQDAKLHFNVSLGFIVTTEDKIRLVLADYLKHLNAKISWHTPASILLAILTAFVSSTFHDAVGLTADTWRALFILFAILSSGWLVYAGMSALKAKDINDLVTELKQSTAKIQQQISENEK